MKNMSRRELCISLPVLAAIGAGAPEALALQMDSTAAGTQPAAPAAASGSLATSRAFGFDQMPVRTMANGGESRDIVHGTLATGETVSLHQSMQMAESEPNPLHTIEHTEFILVREGTIDFIVGDRHTTLTPGSVGYTAPNEMHGFRNAGTVPATYFIFSLNKKA